MIPVKYGKDATDCQSIIPRVTPGHGPISTRIRHGLLQIRNAVDPLMVTALTIAGSDSGGGAGIQADLKTFNHFGVFGTSAITALTAQNTAGVSEIVTPQPSFVVAQINAIMADLSPRAAKTGMLANSGIVGAVAETLAEFPDTALVLDPVMVATSGARLLSDDAVADLRSRLLPRAALVTPNLPEARLLTGRDEDTEAADLCDALLELGAAAVLLKGGHGRDDAIEDWLVTPNTRNVRRHRRLPGRYHGTGCCLSAGIAAGLARGRSLEEAVETASNWLQSLMRRARPGRCGASRILPFEHRQAESGPGLPYY